MEMGMERIIRVGGVDVHQRSCSVAFNASIGYEGCLLTIQTIELTHNKLYKMLSTAKEVKPYIKKENEETSKFCTFKQGDIEFEVYEKRDR